MNLEHVYKDTEDPDAPYGWESGLATCRACGAQWAAVRPYCPSTAGELECPRCHSLEGAYGSTRS